MKQKRVERVEKRRPLLEINLIGEGKMRSTWPPRSKLAARRGCALFGTAAVLLGASAAAFLGLH